MRHTRCHLLDKNKTFGSFLSFFKSKRGLIWFCILLFSVQNFEAAQMIDRFGVLIKAESGKVRLSKTSVQCCSNWVLLVRLDLE